jgi:hypothetical protein
MTSKAFPAQCLYMDRSTDRFGTAAAIATIADGHQRRIACSDGRPSCAFHRRGIFDICSLRLVTTRTHKGQFQSNCLVLSAPSRRSDLAQRPANLYLGSLARSALCRVLQGADMGPLSSIVDIRVDSRHESLALL